MLEVIRGFIAPGFRDKQSNETIDEIIKKSLQLSRTAKMVEMRIQRGLSVHAEYNALTEKPQLSNAHKYSRACVPRRIYAIDPASGGLLRDRVTHKNVTRLRKPGDAGIVTLYHVCPSRCSGQGCKESSEQLSDFGVGIALYFKFTLGMFFLCLFLFLFNVPLMYCNLKYKERILNGVEPPSFCGFDFTNVQNSSVHANRTSTMKLNLEVAIQTAGILNMFDFTETSQPVTYIQIITAVFVCLTLLIAVIVSSFYEESEIDHADQTVYTARDYTIEVRGSSLPPSPEQYKRFYEQRFPGAHVMRVSLVYKGMGNLLRAMSRHLKAARVLAGDHAEMKINVDGMGNVHATNTVSAPSVNWCMKLFQIGGICRDKAWWQYEMQQAAKGIDMANRRLYANDLPPTVAFITFDNELSQHRVMRGMRGDWCDRWEIRSDLSSSSTVTDHIEASHHLDAPEPSDIIWENFDISSCERCLALTSSNLLALSLVVILYLVLLNLTLYTQSENLGPVTTVILAGFVSLINLLLPTLIKLTSAHEIHFRESEVQVSILIKLLIGKLIL